MKSAQTRTEEKQSGRTPARRNPARKPAPISPESRRSTAAALLKHAPGWAGDDLDEVFSTVRGMRAKTRL